MSTLSVFAGGLILGSFLNVVIHRLPRGESIVFPPSHCPDCRHRLKAWELIPVLSFLIQRGRCRGCGGRIPWRYPLVELITGAVLVGVHARYPETALFVFYGWLAAILVAAAFIDIAHRIIPNRLLAAGLAGGVALFPWARPLPVEQAAYGFLLAGAVMLVIGLAGRGGMGGGDIKLAAVGGFFLGPSVSMAALLMAFVVGGVAALGLLLLRYKGRKDFIPFGPYLAAGILAAALSGRPLIDWYLTRL